MAELEHEFFSRQSEVLFFVFSVVWGADTSTSDYYICVLILLYTVPVAECSKAKRDCSTTIYVSSYYCICVLLLPYICPHTIICVSSSSYKCVLILPYVSSYFYMCVLILQCPHTTIYVSSYYYHDVCPHITICVTYRTHK